MKFILADGIFEKDIQVLTDYFGFFELFKDMNCSDDDIFDMSHLPVNSVSIEQLMCIAKTGELPIDLENADSTMYKSLYDTDMCLDTNADIRSLFDSGFIFNRMSLNKSCLDFYKVTVLERDIRRNIALGGTEPFYGLVEITPDVCENTLHTPLSNDCPIFTIDQEPRKDKKIHQSGDKVMTYREPSSETIKNILALGNVVISGGFALQQLASHCCIAQDIDIFVYGLDENEAHVKLQQIGDLLGGHPYLTTNAYTFIDNLNLEKEETAIRDLYLNDIPNMYNITAQVILRLYETPAEILHGFDIPACKVLMMMHEGTIKYYGTPSFVETMRYNAVWIDTERQSSTYALRLIKYYCKFFDVVMTGYNKDLIDKELIHKNLFQPWNTKADRSTIKGFAFLLWLHHILSNEYVLWVRGRSMLDAIRRICINYNLVKSDYVSTKSRHVLRDFLRYAWKSLMSKGGDFWERQLVEVLGWRWVESAKNIPKVKWTVRDPSSQTVNGSFHPEQEKYYHQAYNIKDFNGMLDVAMATL